MAQQVLFTCDCGWDRSLLLGPTMTSPAQPMPKVCPERKDFCDDSCASCPSEPQEWDEKSCPACGAELHTQLLALVD